MITRTSTLAAVLIATIAITITKATNRHRVSLYYFKLLPGLIPTSLHTITTTTNWTLTSAPDCASDMGACSIGSNTAPSVTGAPFFRHMPTIPALHKIPGKVNPNIPGYYINYIDLNSNITDAFAGDYSL